MSDILRKNKGKAILSSLVILLPMAAGLLLWDRLPSSMPIHWGADGVADGMGYKSFAVFGLPALLLALHWFCMLFTFADPKFQDQGRKAVNMIFCICPVISLFVSGIQYSFALGWTFHSETWMILFLAAAFILIGNYMPKVKQNSTLGIKVYWALRDEENWAQTHRFGGKLCVCGGIGMLLCIFLPLDWFLPVLLLNVLVIAIGPMVYSYCFYRRQKNAGTYTETPAPLPKAYRSATIAGTVIGICILALAVLLMFTGSIEFSVDDTVLTITASYYDDLIVHLADIDSIEYRDTHDPGSRTNGFGSPTLSMGVFTNSEFGRYTRYAYTGTDACIILRDGEYVLVISCRTTEETRQLYSSLLEKR